jgi:FKBP12-rapamycin complex-associated protein
MLGQTCTKLIVKPGQTALAVGHGAATVAEVLEKLLIVGIADPDSNIRFTVLSSIDERYDHHLAQAENLRSLFVALNDEVFRIRELVIHIIGRLSILNPAHVMPSLRKTLIVLLTELEFSGDSQVKEESALLLGHLIHSSQKLVEPYVDTILRALLPKLRDSSARVATCVLSALGELARVSGVAMLPHVDMLLPLIIDTLQDQSSSSKREVALKTLGQLASSTGYVIEPLIKHPKLLEILLQEVISEQVSTIRTEVLKYDFAFAWFSPSNVAFFSESWVFWELWTLTSTRRKVVEQSSKRKRRRRKLLQEQQEQWLEPWRQEVCVLWFCGGVCFVMLCAKGNITVQAQGAAAAAAAAAAAGGADALLAVDMSPSNEAYYPTVAIACLMRVLFNPSLSTHHSHVIQAVVFMAKSLDKQSIQFLPQIMPAFLHVLSTCEPGFREFILQQLGRLVGVVKQHIRDYLDDIFALIKKFWEDSLMISIITLVEEISVALAEEFKVYLPDLIPSLLLILHTDRTDHRRHVQKVLHALEVFNTTVDDYLHLIVPAVVRLFEQVDVPMNVRALAIQTLGRLCDKLNFRDHASRIIHPIARVLRKDDLKPLHVDAMNTLCELVFQLGSDYSIFIISVAKILAQSKIVYEPYESLVATLLRNQPLTSDLISHVRQRSRSALSTKDLQEKKEAAGSAAETSNKRLKLNERNLQAAWECAEVASADDWFEWMRNLSQELIRESPSPALRSCLALAQVYYPLARDLFNAAFYSCWVELGQSYQQKLVRSLETSLLSDTIPPEILQQLLNLAEFMEHDDNQLPIDIRTFGVLAAKCRAFAKALHYKEIEFASAPEKTIEALISINNQLQQPQAAVGILL